MGGAHHQTAVGFIIPLLSRLGHIQLIHGCCKLPFINFGRDELHILDLGFIASIDFIPEKRQKALEMGATLLLVDEDTAATSSA